MLYTRQPKTMVSAKTPDLWGGGMGESQKDSPEVLSGHKKRDRIRVGYNTSHRVSWSKRSKLAKRPKMHPFVIPAKAGIQSKCNYRKELDSGSSPEWL